MGEAINKSLWALIYRLGYHYTYVYLSFCTIFKSVFFGRLENERLIRPAPGSGRVYRKSTGSLPCNNLSSVTPKKTSQGNYTPSKQNVSHPSIHPSIHSFIHSFIHPPIHPSIHPLIHPSMLSHVTYTCLFRKWPTSR